MLDFSGVFFSGSEAKKKKALAKKAHGESSRTHATEEIEESSTTVSGTSDVKTSQVKGNKGGKGIRRVAGSETWSLCGIMCLLEVSVYSFVSSKSLEVRCYIYLVSSVAESDCFVCLVPSVSLKVCHYEAFLLPLLDVPENSMS